MRVCVCVCVCVCVFSQVNRVAVWHYDPTMAPSSPPLSSSTQEVFVEPVCECETTVAGDVMDLQWLDEDRMVVGLSTGSVALLHFRTAQKVDTCYARSVGSWGGTRCILCVLQMYSGRCGSHLARSFSCEVLAN